MLLDSPREKINNPSEKVFSEAERVGDVEISRSRMKKMKDGRTSDAVRLS